jgi:chromosome partitioning protein
MQVWVIANQKGGVGKTTTTVSLAGELLRKNYRVLLIDADPQGSLSSYLGYEPETTDASLYQLFENSKEIKLSNLARQIQETTYQNLHLIPSSTSLATIERKTALGGYGLILKKYLSLIDKNYDYILIDCAPSLGILLVNAIAACNKLIIPTQTEFLALKGLERMIRTVQMMVNAGSKQFELLIVPTMFDKRTLAAHYSLDWLKKRYQKALWHAVIPVDNSLIKASRLGLLPSFFCPNSLAVQAYACLVNDLQTQEARSSYQQYKYKV